MPNSTESITTDEQTGCGRAEGSQRSRALKWRDDEAMLMARVGGAVGGSEMRVEFANAQLKLINQRIEVLSEYAKQTANN